MQVMLTAEGLAHTLESLPPLKLRKLTALYKREATAQNTAIPKASDIPDKDFHAAYQEAMNCAQTSNNFIRRFEALQPDITETECPEFGL